MYQSAEREKILLCVWTSVWARKQLQISKQTSKFAGSTVYVQIRCMFKNLNYMNALTLLNIFIIHVNKTKKTFKFYIDFHSIHINPIPN